MKFNTDLLDMYCERTGWENWEVISTGPTKLIVEFNNNVDPFDDEEEKELDKI